MQMVVRTSKERISNFIFPKGYASDLYFKQFTFQSKKNENLKLYLVINIDSPGLRHMCNHFINFKRSKNYSPPKIMGGESHLKNF